MSYGLEGKTALVTGASSGFGWHFTELLVREGVTVAAAARRTDKLEELTGSLPDGKVIPIAMDVGDASSVTSGVNAAYQALGRIDILVNNAGVTLTKPAIDHTEADWDNIIDTNLKGAWLVAQAAARHMQKDGGGSIINIASILGLGVLKQVATYAISKAGMIQMTKAHALEWARDNIRVNAIAPGYVETDFNREFFASEPGQAIIRKLPRRRLGELGELDGPLLLLASDAGRGMTGSVVVVDGGHEVGLP